MNKPMITVSLVALAALLPLASSATNTLTIAMSGDGVLVHEGTGSVEAAAIDLQATASRTFRAAPFTGVDGQGTLTIQTESRSIAIPIFVSGDVLAQTISSRSVESWSLGVGNDDGSGTLYLHGADGFLHGPGSIELFIPSGLNHGRFDVAFAGTAEVVR